MKVGLVKRGGRSIYESAVYRELERQAVKQGFFDPTPEQIVKSAAVKVAKKIKPSGNFEADIAVLIAALREKGLTKQADNIEKNYVIYKAAKSQLYNIPTENLLEFAHSDGDVEIAPSDNDYGKIETVQSAAEKIRAIVETPPKVKAAAAEILKKKAQIDPIAQTEARVQAAFDSIEEAKNSLVLDTSKFKLDNLQDKNVAQIYSELSGVPLDQIERYVAVRQLTNSIFNNKYLDKTQAISALSEAIKNENPAVFNLIKTLGIDISKYSPINENKAIEFLKNTLDPLRLSEKIGLVSDEVTKNTAKLANDVYMGIYNIFINVIGKNSDKFKESVNKIINSYNVLKSALDAVVIPEASQFVSYSQVKYNEIVTFLNSLYDRLVNIFKTEESKLLYRVLPVIAPDEFKKIEDFTNGLGNIFHRATASIPPENSPMREIVPDLSVKLQPAVDFWTEKYNQYEEGTQDKKNAGLNLATVVRLQKGLAPFSNNVPFINLKVALPRIAATLPDELPPQPLAQMNSVDELNKYLDLIIMESQEKKANVKYDIEKTAAFLLPTSETSSKPQGSGRPSAAPVSKSVQGRPTDAEKKNVIAMQRLLGKFAQGLTEKPEEAAKKIGISVDQLRSLAATIGFTGKSGETSEGAHDGKWGPNTIKALKAAHALAEKLGKKGEISDGGVVYTEREPEDVIKDAQKNVEGLVSIMKEADLAPYLGEYNVELDYVPRYRSNWTEQTADPLAFNDRNTGLVIMPEHVKSVRDFFSFVSSIGNAPKAASKEDFQKIAQDVKNSLIIRQDPYGNVKEQAPVGSVSYDEFIKMLQWFYVRSNLVYRTALSKQQAGEPNPLTGKPYTNRDIAIARSYHEQMQRLVSEWKNKYNDYFKEKGHVHSNDFIRAERGDVSNKEERPQGSGRLVNQRTQRDSGGYTIGVGSDSDRSDLEPPLGEFINIFHLAEKYDAKIHPWLVENLRTGVFDRKEWRRNYVDEIVSNYSKTAKTAIENYKFMNILANTVISLINEVFNNWENNVEDYLDEKRFQRLYRKQNREKMRWIEALKGKVNEARRLLRS